MHPSRDESGHQRERDQIAGRVDDQHLGRPEPADEQPAQGRAGEPVVTSMDQGSASSVICEPVVETTRPPATRSAAPAASAS